MFELLTIVYDLRNVDLTAGVMFYSFIILIINLLVGVLMELRYQRSLPSRAAEWEDPYADPSDLTEASVAFLKYFKE